MSIDEPLSDAIAAVLRVYYEIENPKNVLCQRTFTQAPSSWRSERIDELESFAMLGLDVKITPDDEVKIIEVNGIDSGMKGFTKAQVSYNDFLHSIGKKSFLTALFQKDYGCETALKEHILHLGVAQIAYISAYLHIRGKNAGGRIPGAGLVLSNADEPPHRSLEHIHPEWHKKYSRFGRALMRHERFLEDKLLSDYFFRNCRNIKTPTELYDEKGLERVLKNEPEFIVIKERFGYGGYGMHVLHEEDTEKKPQFSGKHVVEAFVPSKPINAKFDGKQHDGCMRYVVFVEQEKSKKIVLHHFGGYWRICPEPVSNIRDIDSMRASLTQGAIAQKATKKELRQVYSAVEQNIPVFYKTMTENLAEFHKLLEEALGECGT
ncbi:hypothetical protein HY484_04160 [Candidatus Woesearchaeota archaeon]|nr:hypothetical protein [Candidatus Woesearchaeota archaeon]